MTASHIASIDMLASIQLLSQLYSRTTVPDSGGSSYGSKGSMEPPFREGDQLTQHHSRTRKNSGQLPYNFSGGSRGGMGRGS